MAEIDVPIISLAGFFSADKAAQDRVVDEIRIACEKCGFFMVRHHGVDPIVVAEAWASCRAFFDSPMDVRTSASQEDGYPYGYVGLQAEIAGGTHEYGVADMKENFSVCLGPAPPSGTPDERMPTPRWPTGPASFQPAVTAYYREMEKLAAVLMRIFASALKVDAGFFEPLNDRHWSALRCLNYPHSDKPFAPGQMRIAAHTDYGVLTILRADDAPGGLQVQMKDGSWRDVSIPPDCFTINLGDLMQRWTNDLWKSTRHRVVPPPVVPEGGVAVDNRRASVAYFANLNRDAVCSVFSSCVTADRPCKYEPINAFDHLMARHAAATGMKTISTEDEATGAGTGAGAGAGAGAGPKIGGADITGAAWRQAASKD
jgi:isopenicillin N synthase-like dioxygenase